MGRRSVTWLVMLAVLTLSSGGAKIAHHYLAHEQTGGQAGGQNVSRVCDSVAAHTATETNPDRAPQPATPPGETTPSETPSGETKPGETDDSGHRCDLCQLLAGQASSILAQNVLFALSSPEARPLTRGNASPVVVHFQAASGPRAPPLFA